MLDGEGLQVCAFVAVDGSWKVLFLFCFTLETTIELSFEL